MSGRSDHLISVLIAFHNRAEYLDEAVRSVLADTSAALEVVMIDDGSTDGAEVVAASFADRAVVVRQEHRGCAAAWNLGLDRTRGDLVAFCDSDDIWLPCHTGVLLDALDADPSVGVVFGRTTEFISPELDPDHLVTRAPHDECVAPLSGAMLARRAVFDAVGRFDEALRQGFWFDWYARLVDLGVKTADVDARVLRRRLHMQNSSIVQPEHLREYARALHASLVRRRAQ
jgi:glycosyltransferase involved in cell wall biosynthesis